MKPYLRLVPPPTPPRAAHPEHVVCLCPNCRPAPRYKVRMCASYTVGRWPTLALTLPLVFSIRREKAPEETPRKGVKMIGYFVARLDQMPIVESGEVQLEL